MSLSDIQELVALWLPRLGVAVVGLFILAISIDVIVKRWWYQDVAVRRLARRKGKVEEAFGLSLGRITRNGVIRIAPGDTERWSRLAANQELDNLLGTPTRIVVSGAHVEVMSRRAIPDSIAGDMRYDVENGTLTVGIDVVTGKESAVKIAGSSAMVIGALPGSGKTVFLTGMAKALRPYAHVTVVDGKLTSAEEVGPRIERIRAEMIKRLHEGVDFWDGNRKGHRLEVLILDESQTIFTPSGTDKESKKSAEERVMMTRDVIQRGRSAGVFIVVATQRMTVDAVPSAIRDLAGVRVCGRVARPEDAELVLGRRSGDLDPSPIGLPPGRMVIDDGHGQWRELQCFSPPR